MKSSTVLVVIALTTGCASITEEQREARAYQEVEWLARFAEDREKCVIRGGHLVVEAGMQRLGRRSTVVPGDRYRCQLSNAFR